MESILYWNDRFSVGTTNHSEQNSVISKDFLKHILPEFDLVLKNCDNIIEIGCGTGELSRMITDTYNKYVLGTDLSPKAIQYAKEHYENSLVRYQTFDIITEELPNKFDVAICSNCLEHFQNPYPMIDKILQCCKLFIVLVPYDQPVTDGYDNEGGAGHVFQFSPDSLDRYTVLNQFTFKTNGWQHSSKGEDPLQWAVLIKGTL